MDGTSCSELDHLAVLDGQATSELLRLVLNSVPSGLLMVDGNGLITMANAAMFDLFRWSPSDLIGRPVEDLVPGSLQETHRQHRCDFGRSPSIRAMGEGRLLHGRRSDGSKFMVEVALSPISIGGAPQVLAVVRDITAHVDAEALARSQHAFQAVSEDRMRIARDLHDSVIQELFAAGLTIANAAASVEGPIADLLTRLIGTLDTSIRHLRGAIFEFRAVEEAGDDIRKIVAEATRILGFEPELTIAGDPIILKVLCRPTLLRWSASPCPMSLDTRPPVMCRSRSISQPIR